MGRIINTFLNWIVGDYIEGIDKKNTTANIFSGKLLLENVSISPKIMQILNVPIGILSSHIGRFEMKIPWFNIATKPIEVLLDEIFIILAPQRVQELDPLQEAIKELNNIQKDCIKTLEAAASGTEDQNEGFSVKGGFSKLLLNIIDNIQVMIIIT